MVLVYWSVRDQVFEAAVFVDVAIPVAECWAVLALNVHVLLCHLGIVFEWVLSSERAQDFRHLIQILKIRVNLLLLFVVLRWKLFGEEINGFPAANVVRSSWICVLLKVAALARNPFGLLRLWMASPLFPWASWRMTEPYRYFSSKQLVNNLWLFLLLFGCFISSVVEFI